MKGKYKVMMIMGGMIILAAGTFCLLTNMNSNTSNSTIGSDNKGYVAKEVYASPGAHQVKIAVIYWDAS